MSKLRADEAAELPADFLIKESDPATLLMDR